MREEKGTLAEVQEEQTVMGMAVEGLSETEVREIQVIFRRFLLKYEEDRERDTVEWLSEQLQEELPERKEAEIREMAVEITDSIEEYRQDLEDLNASCRRGITKESWLAERLQDGAKGMAVNQFGDYLMAVDGALEQANLQMARTVLRADEGISQCVNLDGFIAEQYHVNDFNAKAVLAGSDYRARVCVPDGQYGKNSVDVMVDNVKSGQKGVLRYQFKFGKDDQATARLLEHGDYANQRLVVPKGQVEEVQKAFPGKSVTDHIGGTEEVQVQSSGITKEEAKALQRNVQEDGLLPVTDWNSYQTRELALGIGKQAGQAGIQAAFLGAGIGLVSRAFSGEPIEADEVVKTALETGADAGVKAAAGGALKVASEKSMISLLPPGTPGGTIAKIACVGIENVKTLWKVAKGEMTMSEALEHMGRSSVSMYAGLSAGAVGAGIGAAALSWIPVVGPIVGGIVGGIVGYAAGSKVGEAVFEGAKKVVKTGVRIVKGIAEGVAHVARGIADTLFGWLF